MIKLTRLNRTSLAVNCDLIKFVETAPDTVISLTTGEKVVVKETVDEVIELIIQFRRAVLADVRNLSLTEKDQSEEQSTGSNQEPFKIEEERG